MRRLAAVVAKELRQVRRDAFSLGMLIALPAFMLVLYGFALNFDVRHVSLAVQDRDKSARSRELVAAFTNSTYFDLVLSPEAGSDLDAVTEWRVARAVLVIPEGYARTLASARPASVQLLLDGADSTTAQTVLGYARTLVAEANAALVQEAAARRGLARGPAVSLEPRILYNPELASTQFLVPGLMGFLLMLTAVLSTALSVVREKERGTMEQLRVAPLRTWELIIGKTVPYLGVSLLAAGIILVAARLLFDVRVRGSVLRAVPGRAALPGRRARLRPADLDARPHPGARLPGRPDQLDAARDPALRLHLPDPRDARLAPAGDATWSRRATSW